jgi:hypothetical protein
MSLSIFVALYNTAIFVQLYDFTIHWKERLFVCEICHAGIVKPGICLAESSNIDRAEEIGRLFPALPILYLTQKIICCCVPACLQWQVLFVD